MNNHSDPIREWMLGLGFCRTTDGKLWFLAKDGEDTLLMHDDEAAFFYQQMLEAREAESRHWEREIVPAVRNRQLQFDIDKRFRQLAALKNKKGSPHAD